MQKNAIVRSLQSPDAKRPNVVIVEPLASMECASCSQSCSKKGQTLPAINSRGLDLKVNSIVTISTSKKQAAIESAVSLFFPIAMAVTGFFLSNPLFRFFSSLFNETIKKGSTIDAACPEGLKALIVIIFFALASLTVLLLTRGRVFMIYPEITDVTGPKN